jgi:hypothetical protein
MTAAVLTKPRPAIESRLLEYFRDNPECELTPEAISQKFGCSIQTARNTLTVMRQRGYITTHHVVRPTPQALSLTPEKQSACAGKAVFASMQRAKDRAARMRHKYDAQVTPYKCQHCGEIHLGSREEKKLRDREAEE